MGDVGRLGAAGIGAAADVATNAATNATNAVIANKTNQTSKDIAAANNEMQERLNTTNNEFSASEAEKAYQRQVEQWHREVQYNSPIEQLKRFQEAGLNPSVAFGGNLGSSTSASASSAPMASPHGSGVSPSMPTLIPAHLEDPKVGSAFADIFKALNEGKKQGAEATQINQTMTTLLESLKADVESKNLANALTKAYGDAKASAEIENIVQNTSTSTKLAYVYATQGDLNKAEQALADARKETEKATAALRGEEKKLMEKRNEVFYKQVEADLKTAASQRAANYGAAASGYASANYQNAMAATENAVRDHKVRLFGAEADKMTNEALLSGIDARVESALEKDGWQLRDRLYAIQSNRNAMQLGIVDVEQAKNIYPLVMKMAEQDAKRGDMKDWYYYVDRVLGLLSGTMTGTGAAYVHGLQQPPKATPVKGFGK